MTFEVFEISRRPAWGPLSLGALIFGDHNLWVPVKWPRWSKSKYHEFVWVLIYPYILTTNPHNLNRWKKVYFEGQLYVFVAVQYKGLLVQILHYIWHVWGWKILLSEWINNIIADRDPGSVQWIGKVSYQCIGHIPSPSSSCRVKLQLLQVWNMNGSERVITGLMDEILFSFLLLLYNTRDNQNFHKAIKLTSVRHLIYQ